MHFCYFFKFLNLSKFPTYCIVGWADARLGYIIIQDEVFLLLKLTKRDNLPYIAVWADMGQYS